MNEWFIRYRAQIVFCAGVPLLFVLMGASISITPLPTECQDNSGFGAPLVFLLLITTVALMFVKRSRDAAQDFHILQVLALTISYLIATILLFAAQYIVIGIVDASVQTGGKGVHPTSHWDYIYFSVVTFTTLGYGDFQPCPAVRVAAAFQALIGFLSYPIVTAFLLRWLFAQLDANARANVTREMEQYVAEGVRQRGVRIAERKRKSAESRNRSDDDPAG